MARKELYDLLKIGLTEGEAKVYLALTELGSSTVGPIVKKARVAYSNVYDILNRLIEKGIVSYIINNKTKYFQAASPSNLVDYLEKKEKEIEFQKAALKQVLPELTQLQKIVPQQDAEIFLGKKGLKTAYEKFTSEMDNKEPYCFFYIHEKEYAKEADLFYFGIQHMLKRRNIRGISNENGRNSEFTKQAKYMQMRFVNFPIPGNIEVCKDRLLLVSWKQPIIGVLIHSESIAENFKSYFETVWNVAKE